MKKLQKLKNVKTEKQQTFNFTLFVKNLVYKTTFLIKKSFFLLKHVFKKKIYFTRFLSNKIIK